jgi:SnoaL-like domain
MGSVAEAKEEIREAIYRYCRGEDRLDAELSQSLWHADGTAKYGYNGELFDGPASGWAERAHKGLANFSGSSHQVGNILIEVDGDRAASEAYVTARVWKISEDGVIWQRVTVGRYLDRWSLRDGRWAVDHRRFIFDLSYASEPAGQPNDRPWETAPGWFEGTRGRQDPSYEVLKGLGE